MAKKEPVIVEFIEWEAGWGQRVDDTQKFPSLAKAEAFCRAYNRKHNPPKAVTPEWYMYARIRGDARYEMLR